MITLADVDYLNTSEGKALRRSVQTKEASQCTEAERRVLAIEEALYWLYLKSWDLSKQNLTLSADELALIERNQYLGGRQHASVSEPLRYLYWNCPDCFTDEIKTLWAEGESVECPTCKALFEVESGPSCPEEGNYDLRVRLGKRLNDPVPPSSTPPGEDQNGGTAPQRAIQA